MDEPQGNRARINVTNYDQNQIVTICPDCNKPNADNESCCFACIGYSRSLLKRLKSIILSGPGLTFLLLSYLMIGAVTFNVLEGRRSFGLFNFTMTAPVEKNDRIKESVERLWKITENLNILYKDNWTKLASEEISSLQEYFFDEITRHGYDGHECNTINYYSNRRRNPPFWNLGECFLYSLSLLTTVGSGNVLPRTTWGRIVSIVYITVGFFFMLLYLAVIGEYLANPLRRLYTAMFDAKTTTCDVPYCSTPAKKLDKINVPFWLVLFVMVIYITCGAFVFNYIERWTIIDSWYFCFISLVTIGFGGFTPGRMESISMVVTSAYILIGMSVLSMCFSLVQNEMVLFLKNLDISKETTVS